MTTAPERSVCASCEAPIDGGRSTQCPQCRRQASAALQGQAYGWSSLPDGRSVVDTGENVYIVTPDECGCPDWRYRCANSGMRCKHQVALSAMGEQL